MSVKIRIPKGLEAKVEGRATVEVGGDTIGECVEGLVARYPALKGELLDETGRVLLKWMVYLNGRSVQLSKERTHAVGQGDVIEFFPIIAGG